MYFGTEAAGMRRVAYYSSNFVKWSLLATFVGLFVGGISTLFGHLLLFVNSYRYAHEQVVWLLPFAGLAIVFLYRISDSANPRGTNLVIEAARSEEKLPARMAPLIFVSTILTHLCGGSAGREGAALQLGGSLGQLLGDKLRIEEENRNIMVLCGMSAGFSALFGTPIAAAIFPLGLASIGMIYYTALVPCTISSLVSYWVALYFGLSPERFRLAAFETTPILALRVVLLAVLCAVVSILMCAVLHQTGKLFQSIFPNQYLRIVVGGSLICLAAGYSMVVFPEGTRTETGEVGEFKAGAFKIAQKNKVPVVPFVLEGSSRLMGKHSLWIHPASVTVKILEPIDTSGYGKEEWRALPALAGQRVKDGLALLRAGGR